MCKLQNLKTFKENEKVKEINKTSHKTDNTVLIVKINTSMWVFWNNKNAIQTQPHSDLFGGDHDLSICGP